jgi:ABC-type antimicrobial peptide transport system permease subunit
MIKHYLKIAVRNIRKYAIHNIISILGLMAGFVCRSLSSLWIKYENSFDSFHKDADRIFTFSQYEPDGKEFHMGKLSNTILLPFFEDPNIESYTGINFVDYDNAREICVDSTFFDIFDIKLVSGDWSFLGNERLLAITSSYADSLFHGQNPIGLTCHDRKIVAVVDGFNKPSVLSFDLMSYRSSNVTVESYTEMILNSSPDTDDEKEILAYFQKIMLDMSNKTASIFFIKLYDKVNIDSLSNKVDSVFALASALAGAKTELQPIKGLHTQNAKNDMYFNYQNMQMFFYSSLLLMSCAIANLLLFFLSKIRKRERELALRTVNGSSASSLIGMLAIEVGLIVGISLILGFLFVFAINEQFVRLADPEMTGSYIVGNSFIVMFAVFIVSMIICSISIYIVRHRSMQSSIVSRKNNSTFRKVSLGLQLFIGVLFIFAASVMIHQFRFLRNENWGIKINDQAVVSIIKEQPKTAAEMSPEEYGNAFVEGLGIGLGKIIPTDENEYQTFIEGQFGLSDKYSSLPVVEEMIPGVGDLNYFVPNGYLSGTMRSVDCKIDSIDNMTVDVLGILDNKNMRVIGVTVLEGSIPDRPIADNEIVITENLQKELGLDVIDDNTQLTIENMCTNMYTYRPEKVTGIYHVIAVIKDVHRFNYDEKPSKMIFCSKNNKNVFPIRMPVDKTKAVYTLRYHHGNRKEFTEQLTAMMNSTGLDYEVSFSEDKYFAGLTHDKHLFNLILMLGVICMLISVFGVWSIITLTCQERRREIAVRKVHGAKVRDILAIFAREYGAVLLATSVVAFGVGYVVMHKWLEQFQKQAVISWWIYAVILLGMAAIICLTVIQRIMSTARENPADVIKSE